MKLKSDWKRIPFLLREYYVTRRGEIISGAQGSLKKLKLRKISPKNPRFTFDALSSSKKQRITVLVNRVVFFCFVYPEMIGKTLEKMNLKDFMKMPFIAHSNGNVQDNHPRNLVPFSDRTKLGIWFSENFPGKTLKHKKQSSIQGEDLHKVTKWLREGKSYPWIAKQIDLPIHPQVIYRLNKKLGISKGRPNGKSKLTQKQKSNIKKMLLQGKSGVELAKKFNTTETTISRIKRGRPMT